MPTERPDAWEVQARGELQLAVLVETMRREGFEMTVGKPQVVTREIDGKLHEPVERAQRRRARGVPRRRHPAARAPARASSIDMVNHGTGWVRIEQRVPARGLLGFRTEFLTETRGTGMLHQVFDGWAPWFGEIRSRDRGSIVADRSGPVTGYAVVAVQERGVAVRRPRRRGLRGHDHRRELPRRGHGRQHLP